MPKISALPAAASVNLTDILPEVSPSTGGTTYQATFNQVLSAFEANSGNTWIDQVVTNGLTATGSVSNDFSGSTGTFKTSTGANQLSGAVTITDAATPSLTTSAGKTNTGFIQINGKTSGAFKIITADATLETVTLSLAAQTSGNATLTIPDMAGSNKTIAFTTGTVTTATNLAGGLANEVPYQTGAGATSFTSAASQYNVLVGGVSGAPNFGQVNLAQSAAVTGVLPVANGGTNASTASITSFNNITGYTASGATGTTSTNLVFSGSPTIVGTFTVSGTSPVIVTAAGQTNTGVVQINGKTSGALAISTADATGQQLNLMCNAQTVGSATLSIPNLAGTNATLALTSGTVATVKQQIFTTSGTYTPSAGMLYCIVRLTGGGGGSGGVAGNVSGVSASSGGAGGGYAEIVLSATTIGASQTVTIGAGGTAGVAGNNFGGTGGTTSLGTLAVATGGSGGVGGVSRSVLIFVGASGLGGIGTTGTILLSGQPTPGYAVNPTGSSVAGFGGASIFGFGGYAQDTPNGDGPGHAGLIGGGGAGGALGSTTDGTGSVGGAGIIIIDEYCNQ